MSSETEKFVEDETKFIEGKQETSCLGGCMGDCAQNCVTQKELEGMVEDVMNIKTKELEETLCKKIDAVREKFGCFIKKVEVTDDCAKFAAGQDENIVQIDPTDPCQGSILYIKADHSIHDTFYQSTLGIDTNPYPVTTGQTGQSFSMLSDFIGGPKCYKNESCKTMCGTIQYMGVPAYIPTTTVDATPEDEYFGLFSILEVSVNGGAWTAVDVRALEETGYFQNHVNHMLGHFNISLAPGEEVCFDMRIVVNSIPESGNTSMIADNVGLTINADTLC